MILGMCGSLLCKSHRFGCPYSNETPEIVAKRPSFGPQLDPGNGLNPSKLAQINLGTLGSPKIQDARVVQATWAPSLASDMSEYGSSNQTKGIQLINTSAFGTNSTGELTTSGLPVIRHASTEGPASTKNQIALG
jgi:hypothetical protein